MAADYFLKIEGVPGASTDSEHKEWIEVLSYSHGVSQTAGEDRSAGEVSTEGRCDHQNISIIKRLDKTSPTLDLYCCRGTQIDGKVVFQLCSSDKADKKVPYMEYIMEEAIISGVSIGGTGGGERPTESITFNYGKLTWKYHEPGGTVEKYWSLKENKGG